MDPSLGQRLAELRRSAAAGIHGKKSKDRRNAKRKKIEQEHKDNHGE